MFLFFREKPEEKSNRNNIIKENIKINVFNNRPVVIFKMNEKYLLPSKSINNV